MKKELTKKLKDNKKLQIAEEYIDILEGDQTKAKFL